MEAPAHQRLRVPRGSQRSAAGYRDRTAVWAGAARPVHRFGARRPRRSPAHRGCSARRFRHRGRRHMGASPAEHEPERHATPRPRKAAGGSLARARRNLACRARAMAGRGRPPRPRRLTALSARRPSGSVADDLPRTRTAAVLRRAQPARSPLARSSLVHRPFVGPTPWKSANDHLRRRNRHLRDDLRDERPRLGDGFGRRCTHEAMRADKRPAFAGLSEAAEGLEPSTFCMQ